MKILYLITARGGSKRIPGKNLRTINGLSLVGFKAISGRLSRHCGRLVISTDCPRIQEEARRFGVDVPFTRPAELATDSASSFDTILHAMNWIEDHDRESYDAVMLLEPSTPFTRPCDYDAAVDLMLRKDANVVVGMREMEVNSLFVGPLDRESRITRIVEKMCATGRRSFRGQELRPEYTMNGALYLFRWQSFKEHRSFYRDPRNTYGYVMDRLHSIEIDEAIDLNWSEFLIEKGMVDFSIWESAMPRVHRPNSAVEVLDRE